MEISTRANKPATCQWCNTELPTAGRGRPRKFCSAACKQRAYEQRSGVRGTAISDDAVVLSPAKFARFKDGLFELRCSAEDIETAVGEGANAEEVAHLCQEMVSIARRLEELR